MISTNTEYLDAVDARCMEYATRTDSLLDSVFDNLKEGAFGRLEDLDDEMFDTLASNSTRLSILLEQVVEMYVDRNDATDAEDVLDRFVLLIEALAARDVFIDFMTEALPKLGVHFGVIDPVYGDEDELDTFSTIHENKVSPLDIVQRLLEVPMPEKDTISPVISYV